MEFNSNIDIDHDDGEYDDGGGHEDGVVEYDDDVKDNVDEGRDGRSDGQ